MRRPGCPWRVLFLFAACAGLAQAAEPRPAPLARYFPRKDLIAYVEFDGTDAHAEAWKKTAFARMLAETPSGSMLEKVATQILEALLPPPLQGFATPDDVSKIVSQTARSGFAFGINRKAGDPSAKPSCVGLVLRAAGRGPLQATIKMVMTASGLPPETLTKFGGIDKPGGRKLTLIGSAEGPSVAWWFEKDDLVVSILDLRHADAMIEALDGKVPNAIDHPNRLELAATVDGFEPIGLAFLDTTALPEMPPEAAMFGLDGIKRLDLKWGYQGDALVSVSRIVAPSPRRGVLAMFDQPTFNAKSLPPLPTGVGSFTVFSLDPGKVYDQLAALAKFAEPKSVELLAEAEKSFREATGRRLREDVLTGIGPRIVLADVPTQIFVSSDRFSNIVQSAARVPRTSLLIELPDRAEFLKDLDALATWANAQVPKLKDKPGQPDRPLFRRIKNIEAGYEVALSPTYLPLPAGYRPSIVVGEKFAAIGTSPEVARKALRKEGELGESLDRAIASLPGDLTILSVTDSRNSAWPEVLANVPSLIQWWGFMIQGTTGGLVRSIRVETPQVRTVTTPAEVPPDPTFPIRGEAISTVPAPTVAPALEPVGRPVAPAPVSVPPSVTPAPAVVAPSVAPTAPAATPSPGPPPQVAPEGPISPLSAIPALQFRLRLDPDEVPTPEEIRPYLFAATYTMSVDDKGFRITSRESVPSLNPVSLAPLAVAAALPLYQQWWEENEKERISANLKKIGLALHSFHEKNDHFPHPSTVDKEGKPLLSWRVELLPFLGEKDLYDEFHRDEPWDGPHNKALIERMPRVFAHPDGSDKPGMTPYRGLIGKSGFFDPDAKANISFVSFTDGTSNTMALVEAKEAVPWSKPGTEIPVPVPVRTAARTAELLALLGGRKPGGFQALLVDGSVRFVRDSINLNVLQALTTRDGGEVISADSF